MHGSEPANLSDIANALMTQSEILYHPSFLAETQFAVSFDEAHSTVVVVSH